MRTARGGHRHEPAGTTRVTFAGTPAAFGVASDTRLDATVPAEASSGPIAVTTPGGTASSSSGFTVLPPAPSITSFAPTRGLTLTGASFSGAGSVAFGSTPAASFTVLNDRTILAHVPAGARSGKISVSTPEGTGTSRAVFTVLP